MGTVVLISFVVLLTTCLCFAAHQENIEEFMPSIVFASGFVLVVSLTSYLTRAYIEDGKSPKPRAPHLQIQQEAEKPEQDPNWLIWVSA